AYADPFAYVEAQEVKKTKPATKKPKPAVAPTPSPSPTKKAAELPRARPFTLSLVDSKEQNIPGIESKHAINLKFYPEGERPKYSVTRAGGYSGTIDVFLEVEAISGGKKRLIGKYSEEEYDSVLGAMMIDYDSVKRRLIYGLNENGIQISVPALLAAGGGIAAAHVLFILATRYGVESEWRLIRWVSEVPNLYKKFRDRYHHRLGAGSVAASSRTKMLLNDAFKGTWIILENAAVGVPTYKGFKELVYKIGLSEEQNRLSQASSILTCAHTLYRVQQNGKKPSLHECALPLSSLNFSAVTADLAGIPLDNGMTYGEYAEALAEEGVEAGVMANPSAIAQTSADLPAPELKNSPFKTVYPLEHLDAEVLPAVELIFSDQYYKAPSAEIQNLVDEFIQGFK
ncbi:MAG: hypothetical protein AAB425_14965, partial [Bdellovibrionota bacterium]